MKLLSNPDLTKLINYWLPPILWASVIFLFSSHPTGTAAEIDWQDFIIKKLAHIVEYAILATFLFRGFKGSGFAIKKALIYSFVIAVLYGLSDEFHQSFTPGREPHLRDVLFDTIGAAAALLSIWKLLPQAPKTLLNLAKRLELL